MYDIEKNQVIELVNKIVKHDPNSVDDIIAQLVQMGYKDGVFGYDSLSVQIIALLVYINVLSDRFNARKGKKNEKRK